MTKEIERTMTMSETDNAMLAADTVDERAEAFLEADNKQARLEGRFWSSLTCMADFAQRESKAAVLAEKERIGGELCELIEEHSHGPDMSDALFKYANALMGIKI